MNSGVKTIALTHEETQAGNKPAEEPRQGWVDQVDILTAGARCPVCPIVGLDPSVHAVIIAHPEGEKKGREMAMGGFMN